MLFSKLCSISLKMTLLKNEIFKRAFYVIRYGKIITQNFKSSSARHLSQSPSSKVEDGSLRNGIVKSDYGVVPLPNQDFCTFLFSRWEKWPENEAFECFSTGRKLTFAELLDASLRWGGALGRLVPDVSHFSVPPTVSIFAPNVIEYCPVVFGTIAAGWSLSTINSNYKIAEIMHSLKTTEPKLLVVDPTLEDLADEALLKLEMAIPVITIGPSKRGKPNLREILQDPKAEKCCIKPSKPLDTALILQSGGTTGLPKSVAIPHKSLTNSMFLRSDQRFIIYGGEEYPFVTNLGLMPFYHLYGIYVILVTLFLGSKIIILRNFDANTFGGVIRKHQIRSLHLVPTLLNFIVSSPLVKTEHLTSVKSVSIAASTVLPAAAHAFKEKAATDIIFQEGYGMTEILSTHTTPKDSARIGFCGKLLPNFEAKIIDLANATPLGPGEKGEMLIRGPTFMTHYINNPEATAVAIDEDGWMHTGDVATYTQDGYFSIVDRLKDLIKVKDLQVSPAEIEDVLMQNPAVAEAGVIGVPDEKVGERPRAYVILKGKATEEELVRFIEDRLAPHKRLTGGVRFINELPKSQAGKLLRRELKDAARNSL